MNTVRAVIRPLLLAPALVCASQALSNGDTQCASEPELATADYDFTASIDRWGQDSRDTPTNQSPLQARRVFINPLPIFDVNHPGEDYALYRWANRAHYTTQKSVIRKLLLFHEGETVDRRTLDESERILREQSYIADADIRTVRRCNGKVDLEVITREVWTLIPEISYKTTGGHSEWRLGTRDSNFLGSGKRITLAYKSDRERDSTEMHYTDTNLFGKHMRLRMHWAESSDGHERLLQTSLPFYELDSKRSWEVSAKEEMLDQSEYILGDKVGSVATSLQNFEASRGFSRGLVDDIAHRFTFGVTKERRRYEETEDKPVPVSGLPEDLDLGYPWFQYESIEDNYIVAFNIDQIDRAEDLHVGRFVLTRIGYSPIDDGNLIFNGEVADTLIAEDKGLLRGGINWQSRWNRGSGSLEDSRVDLSLRYHRGQTKNRTLFVGLNAAMGKDLKPWDRISLGGDMGMKGFPANYHEGDMRWFVTLEERIYTDFHPFHLLDIGVALFADAGRAWFREQGAGSRDVLADVGFGLRLIPSKSDKGQVIHLDVAHPLNNDLPNLDSLQVSVEMKKSL